MSENQIVVYQPNETVRLDVRLENETVWLNQSRIGELFGVDRTVVNRHIHNIYKTGELDEPSTCAKIAQVQKEGGRSITRQIPFYNLDIIIAVGYRVNSFAATQFRKWATTILREYLLRGYAFNQRMNQLEDKIDRRMSKTEQDVVELKEKVETFGDGSCGTVVKWAFAQVWVAVDGARRTAGRTGLAGLPGRVEFLGTGPAEPL